MAAAMAAIRAPKGLRGVHKLRALAQNGTPQPLIKPSQKVDSAWLAHHGTSRYPWPVHSESPDLAEALARMGIVKAHGDAAQWPNVVQSKGPSSIARRRRLE